MIFLPIDKKLILFLEEEFELVTFDMVVFPALRRANLPRLIANEIISVQPLPPPSGHLFYFVPHIEGATYIINNMFTVSSRAKGTLINGIIFYPVEVWNSKR